MAFRNFCRSNFLPLAYCAGTTLGAGVGAGMYVAKKTQELNEKVKQLESENKLLKGEKKEIDKEEQAKEARRPFLTIPN